MHATRTRSYNDTSVRKAVSNCHTDLIQYSRCATHPVRPPTRQRTSLLSVPRSDLRRNPNGLCFGWIRQFSLQLPFRASTRFPSAPPVFRSLQPLSLGHTRCLTYPSWRSLRRNAAIAPAHRSASSVHTYSQSPHTATNVQDKHTHSILR